MGQLDSARYYLDIANQYFANSPDADTGIRFYVRRLYASLALAENNLTEAHKILSEPYDPSIISPVYLYEHNKRLVEYYTKTGDYQKVNQYQKMVTLYDDSLRSTRYQNSIAEMDMRTARTTALLRRDVIIAIPIPKFLIYKALSSSASSC